MPSQCNQESLQFHPLFRRAVQGQSDGGTSTTDAAGLLGRDVEKRTGQAASVFKEFAHQTRESWAQARRVVAKAERLEKNSNSRFGVTSLPSQNWAARALYEALYCARGEMENRIKEQLMLFSDRTSTGFLRSNQIRVYFSAVAYLLLPARLTLWRPASNGGL